VSDGVNGIVVQPGAPDQVARPLTALVTDEGLRARLGAAARGRAIDSGLGHWYQRLARLWAGLVGPALLDATRH
jgi:hypothetical protein